MKGFNYCTVHQYKIIFETEQDGWDYIRENHPGREFETYPCPDAVGHYHIRDKARRRSSKNRKKMSRIRKWHDGY